MSRFARVNRDDCASVMLAHVGPDFDAGKHGN
jgi:hypothetical protein